MWEGAGHPSHTAQEGWAAWGTGICPADTKCYVAGRLASVDGLWTHMCACCAAMVQSGEQEEEEEDALDAFMASEVMPEVKVGPGQRRRGAESTKRVHSASRLDQTATWFWLVLT